MSDGAHVGAGHHAAAGRPDARRRAGARREQARDRRKRRRMNGRIHFIGICGTAMATLAAMLKRKGFDVGGSDQDVYPPMSDFLASEAVPALTGYSAEHITGNVSLVVVGNAISRGNPELEEVLN